MEVLQDGVWLGQRRDRKLSSTVRTRVQSIAWLQLLEEIQDITRVSKPLGTSLGISTASSRSGSLLLMTPPLTSYSVASPNP